ncbi:hypothetical protein A3A71_03210 [Candidatus Berkelbacteria bacterium RIFCSPLOWO2_01_FULL_50_28]|uniref:Uncharacterized protein n=1 Tax=Candidatus Berkelbacteria bacterium RIFCSPLOWO2_01_FULL_50_28 TaxID=1797471 RepID=A0A1F5ECJ4_9BACT|nr:MAG: hypothetical protein A2807_02775 [Candidatus Berkelbacteria bacterium RIFCSPHIGHO2_01_FULL_50_36]OGD63798.1 MAG: hypothetical protein A3F39_03610 [Candidatus Berkelbacteria bacterium RIFCSPHIGHO2_12_FULL_50_11]OGD65071.1 MAG: hypothetical protein A3A71_03210 [Candidatus Berkelbacteria bacterium RIFCSPLOWO2_01_FULL_50_28]
MPANLGFDRDLIAKDIRRLASMYLNRQPPFNHLPPEQFHFPEQLAYGSLEHALFLGFAGWLQRNGMDGEMLAKYASHLATECPWVFDPRHPKSQDRSEFTFLYQFIPYSSRDKENLYKPITMWFDALQIIRERYAGDWRHIFLTLDYSADPIVDRKKLIGRLDDLPGVGPKIAQLIIQWFQEVNWSDDLERWHYIRTIPAIAVDLWLMRLVYQFGYITSWDTDIHTAISGPISDTLCQICYEEGIEHHAVGQALWRIGAVICRRRPRNDAVKFRRYCKAYCPAFEVCQRVVPANYSLERRLTGSASGRLASMQWGRSESHPAVDLADLTDSDPGFLVKDFVPKPRNFGGHAIVKARAIRRQEARDTQIELLGAEYFNGYVDPSLVELVLDETSETTSALAEEAT